MNDCIENQVQLTASLSRVWQALTDYREFAEWFGVKLNAPFVVNQAAKGSITHPGYEHIEWNVVIKTIDPAKHCFAFSWHPYAVAPNKDYSGETPTLVEFNLRSQSNKTLFIMSECGFDQIPNNRREEAYTMHVQGWAQQMKNIADYLAQK